MDPALFYPDEESESYDEDINAAKAVCGTCPVQAQCLFLGMNEDHGVWGKTSPTERKAMRNGERSES